jgi:hypothetical protein
MTTNGEYKFDIVDINVRLIRESAKAVLVTPAFREAASDWVPKSLVEIAANDDGKTHALSLPEWLARQKGFL